MSLFYCVNLTPKSKIDIEGVKDNNSAYSDDSRANLGFGVYL